MAEATKIQYASTLFYRRKTVPRFCGPMLLVINPDMGEVSQAHIFVATLGTSDYTYDGTERNKIEVDCHVSDITAIFMTEMANKNTGYK